MPRARPGARFAIAIFACLAALPAGAVERAHAATVEVTGGTLRYVAAPGEAAALTVAPDVGAVAVTEGGLASLGVRGGCATTFAGRARCTGVSRIALVLGPGDDHVTSTSSLATTVQAGDGDDTITLGGGADTLDGGAGADVLRGGGGTDLVDYGTRTARVFVTLDGLPGDGEAGEGDDVGADVENVTGGAGSDRLTGSAAANVLRGGDGDDRFVGGAGADSFAGGAGQDIADYTARTEDLRLDDDGVADDGATGEADNIGTDVDDLLGGSGDDVITGSTWFNTLRGNDGDDVLRGGDGDDRLDGGRGADALDGGSGLDTVDYSGRTAPVHVDLLSDGAIGEAGENDHIVGGVNAALGGSAADVLVGDDGQNVLSGGGGDDRLDGRRGPDDLRGGDGWDVVTYASRRSAVSVSLDDGSGDGQSGEGDNVHADVDEVLGGAGADRLRGDGDANVLRGGAGDDDVWGGGGNDHVDGDSGADDVWAGAGDDRLELGSGGNRGYGEDGADAVIGGGSGEQLDGGSGNDTVLGEGGDDRLYGGSGDDHVDGAAGNDSVEGWAGADRVFGGDGNDSVRGQEDGDVLSGGAGNDTLEGGGGDDQLDAGDGADKLNGNDGNDGLAAGPGNDQLNGGGGNDAVDAGDGENKAYGEAGDDHVWAGPGRDQLEGGPGADRLEGGEGNDRLVGNADGDALSGAGGDDTLDGGTAGDSLDGGAGEDRLVAGDGDDALHGGAGEDTLDGGDDADRLGGGEDNDAVRGGTGPDVVDGGPGDDALDGGSDEDRLQGGDGADELAGRGGDDVLDGGAGPDELQGDEGDDTADYGARTAPVKVTNDGKSDDGAKGEGDDVATSVDRVLGGAAGDDLRQTQAYPAVLDGGAGDDVLVGGSKDDELRGGDGKDKLSGAEGKDRLDAGAGADELSAVDGEKDWIGCGDGRDAAKADRTDTRQSCEKLTWGTPKKPGTANFTPATAPATSPTASGLKGTKLLRGRGRFVSVPGSPGIRVDRRLLADIRYLKAKYKIAITAGYALQGHAHNGEHPVGLGLDIVPGAGGSWRDIDRLARWAEPRQNRPRAPFRWVGYNGDPGHGRGHHLHLSWSHAPTKRGRPAPWVRVLNFKGGTPTRSPGASLRPLAFRSNRGKYPKVRTGLRAAPRCQGAGQLRPTWKAAGKAFGIRWTVLASITQIESSFGCNMGPSSAGAIGWTQFMPGTWRMWGMDADGDGKASPYNSVDAIFSSARYLRASGAPKSYRRALFAYNHATWYVNKVLAGARKFR